MANEGDLVGPLWFTFKKDAQSYCLSFNELGSVNLVSLSNDDIQPYASNNVLVGHFFGDKYHFSMKTSHGRYIGYDKYGFIETTKEAVGPHELWTPIFIDELDNNAPRLLFKRKTKGPDDSDCFLQYDFDLNCLRADIEDQENATKFHLFCQAARKNLKATSELRTAEISPIDISNYEDDQMKRYLSCYSGKLPILKGRMHFPDIDLKKAEESGHLHSLLLDRREKLKSDKYCK